MTDRGAIRRSAVEGARTVGSRSQQTFMLEFLPLGCDAFCPCSARREGGTRSGGRAGGQRTPRGRQQDPARGVSRAGQHTYRFVLDSVARSVLRSATAPARPCRSNDWAMTAAANKAAAGRSLRRTAPAHHTQDVHKVV